MGEKAELEARLDLLVNGLTGLSHDGRFSEPNLDGTAGDYISFDSWEWPQGVGLYGLAKLWKRTRSEALLSLLEGWYDRRIAAGLPPMNVNTTAPLLALSVIWRECRQKRYEAVMAEWSQRIVKRFPRTPEGGFQHDVSDRINENELWDDTLFMVALFLASWGEGSGRRDLVEEAEHQFLVHTRFLADPVSGLWRHGWTFDGRHNFAGALWARGNAWITAGILDLVEMASINPSVRSYLLGVLSTQVEALLRLQRPSGAWTTLLDDPASYEEMSATAGFGYALMKGARLGLGDRRWMAAGRRALDCVVAHIDGNGTLAQVSYGTRMGHDLQFYRDIPIQPTGYGQALAILCIAEAVDCLTEQGETSWQ